MTWLQLLVAEFAITITNADVWLSIGLALLLGGACLVFGVWVARTVGLLRADAPAGETLAVGLASGLMVLAAWWAAIWSGGRSSFTPVAVGFAIAIALAVARQARSPVAADALVSEAAKGTRDEAPRWSPRGSLVLTVLAGGVFVVAVALLYGSTMAPSPRDDAQPVEYTDEAFYAVLGRDLATTGTEASYSPSGFSDLPGLPAQTWYHWGELWLASAVITVFGTAPMAARFFVVLPVVLLSAAALTGTIVRRFAETNSLRAYLFGFAACLFLAPVPVPGPFFSSWAVGMVFGITLYGLAAVAVLLSLYCAAVVRTRSRTWPLAGFIGSAAAFILPAHLAIGVLALVGAGCVATIRIQQSVIATRRLPIVSRGWGRTLIATSVAIIATVVWGLLTGHALGASGFPPSVPPFSSSWRDSVALTALGSGALLLIPVAWFVEREKASVRAGFYVGTMALLLAGAIAWGAWLGEVTMFHLFYGGIAVFSTAAAAVGVRLLFQRVRDKKHLRLAASLVVISLIQLEVGVVAGLFRMHTYGQRDYPPISLNLLDAIRQLPADAKLAYACRSLEEAGFADPSLLSIDAHTHHRVVPMCFQADLLSTFIGAPRSIQLPISSFKWAPQRSLYPAARVHPTPAAVARFLKDNGIDYIYADSRHPNSLVAGAVPIAQSGEFKLLRIP